ncbi:carbohydrate-binding protein [Flagellimonas eckloniae]|uniref:Carbohydrate-binding protein n=1 Tax=Flagellimonas eckloniae TaxID=346185 RepID=A0A0Q1BET7_9FLAO|nr:carbohydrate-binding protein [Allomuricauda eckloniae]KQC28676.1 hypothetical protein AAY42_01235 [Allomuricauda eckloniae]
MIKKIKTILFLTLMLLSITGYAQVTDPNTKVQWLEGSWGVRLYVRGGAELDQYISNGYDYVAGAQEIIAKYPTIGHVLTNMTQNARTNKFTLRYNPNVHAVTGLPNFVINEDFVPTLANEQVIIDVINVCKQAGKKVLLYLNCKEFTAVDTSGAAEQDWIDYYDQYFNGDEYAARTNLMEGYMKRFKALGVDGYWLDAAAMNERNLQLVAMMRALDPDMIFSINTDKSVFKNPDGSNMVVVKDDCNDGANHDNYGVIKYAMNDVEGDFTGGHIFPLGQGGRGDSWAHDEFTIADIQEDNYQLFEGKKILKHMFLPMRDQWSVASATLQMTDEIAYRMTKKITMAGGAVTFSCTTTDGTIKDDEDAILTYVNQKMAENNPVNYPPYVRPACAVLQGEDGKTAQSISFSAIGTKAVGDADFDPGATATSNLAVSYISSNPAVATIVNNKVRIVGAGLTRITARQNGNTNTYRHAPFKHQTLTVTGGSNGGGGSSENLALNGTATQSTTLSGAVASRAIDDNTNGNFGGGSVTASQGPNAFWQVDLGAEYNIGDINVFNRTNGCCTSRLSDFTVSVINSNGATTYSETITSTPNPSVTIDANGAIGDVVRIQSNLTTTLNLAEVQVFESESSLLDQTITFPNLPSKQVGDANFSPGATATSGLGVSYTSSNTSVATIVNGNINIQGAGTTNITASQAGDGTYNAAPSVTRTLTVTSGNSGGGTTNLALNGTATQSTTLSGGVASRAIDDNTNGAWGGGSVTASEGPNAWWEVDLGGSFNIDDINVFNRTNGCCTSRLSNFTVSVINGSGATTYSETITTEPDPSVTIDAGGAVGEVIRIQSNLTSTLNLAEVQVFGSASSCASFSTLESEGYNSMSGVVTESTSDTGGGQHVGFIENADWISFNSIDLTCATSIQARVSCNTSGGNIQVRLGGVSGTLIGTIPVSNTGGWNSWTTLTNTNLSAVSGTHNVYLVFTGGSGYLLNLNWVEFSAGSQQSALKSNATLIVGEPVIDYPQDKFVVYPNPAANSVIIDFKSPEIAKMEIIGSLGETIRSGDIENGTKTVDLSGLSSGMYIIKVSDGAETFTKKIIKK